MSVDRDAMADDVAAEQLDVVAITKYACEKYFDGLVKQLDAIEKQFDGVAKQFDGNAKHFDELAKWFDGNEMLNAARKRLFA
jgi:hypothetical protein